MIGLNYAVAQSPDPIDTVGQEKAIEPVDLISIPEQAAVDIQHLRIEYLPIIQKDVLSSIRTDLDSIKKDAETLAAISLELLEEQNPYEYFESFTLRWSRIDQRLNDPESKMNDYAEALEQIKEKLKGSKEKWLLTQEATLEESISEEINERVESTIFRIDSVYSILNDSLNRTLSQQNEITNIKLQIGEFTVNLERSEKTKFNQLIAKREDFIWNDLYESDTVSQKYNNSKLFEYNLEDTREFLKSETSSFFTLFLFFFLILAGIFWMRSRVAELRSKELDELDDSLILLKNPISLSFMFTFLITVAILPVIPYVVRLLYSMIFVLPFLFIYHKIVISRLRGSLYYFFSIFLTARISALFFLHIDNNRWFILLEAILIIGFFAWFILNKKSIKQSIGNTSYLFNFINFATPFYLFITLASVFSNIVGYDNLSQVINDGVIQSVIVGMILVIAYLSLQMLFYLFLKTNFASQSRVLNQYESIVYLWFKRFLVLFVAFFWVRSTFRGFLSWNIVTEWIGGIWSKGYQFGEIIITIGGVVTFFVIIIAGWMVSKVVEVILRDELLSRFKLARGIPMAVSSLTQYVLVFFGFILAMAFVGFDLSSLGLLAGALGVGIGFGLQNIIGNFISGLILVFERPITVGDTVTVDNLMGTVTSIGIRASVIRLYDESEVIVPNTDLISNKVTNWSLSNNVRRRKLEVFTTMDVDPDRVRYLLINAAKEAEDSLGHPEPEAYFDGIEGQSFQFNLYYWLTDNLFKCDSDVNTNVINTLRENKIEIMVPMKVELKEGSSSSS